jgi:hypothetical protein
MRRSSLLLSLSLLTAILWFGLQSTRPSAAEVGQQAPQAAPAQVEKWEYAQLQHVSRRTFEKTLWITGEGASISGTDWEDFATKLKVPAVDTTILKDASAVATDAIHEMRILNYYGGEGWEMCSHTHIADTTKEVWFFKRRVGR